jgi:hypothetical protein
MTNENELKELDDKIVDKVINDVSWFLKDWEASTKDTVRNVIYSYLKHSGNPDLAKKLAEVEEALRRMTQSSGSKMDYGSNDDSHQACYILSQKALTLLSEIKKELGV